MAETRVRQAALPPERVAERISDALDSDPEYQGWVLGYRFLLDDSYGAFLGTQLHGDIRATPEGSEIRCTFRRSLPSRLVTIVWFTALPIFQIVAVALIVSGVIDGTSSRSDLIVGVTGAVVGVVGLILLIVARRIDLQRRAAMMNFLDSLLVPERPNPPWWRRLLHRKNTPAQRSAPLK